jgi:hypothetical protein
MMGVDLGQALLFLLALDYGLILIKLFWGNYCSLGI